MDPTGLAMLTAGLVAKKAAEAIGDKAGEGSWSALGGIVERIRTLFTDRGDETGLAAVEVVESAPDSQLAVDGLARALTAAIDAQPEFGAELAEMIERLQDQAPGPVAEFVTEVRDNAQVGRIIQIRSGDYYERSGE